MSGGYYFEKIEFERLDYDEYNGIPGKKIFTTREWIEFVAEDSGVTPIFVRITDENGFCGYFTGMSFRMFGIKIVGSPFNGWSTCHMGLDMLHPEEKLSALPGLVEFLYSTERCLYMEITDRDFDVEEAKKRGFKVVPISTLQLRIDMDDTLLFKQMKTDCRNFIRQFERRGASIEAAEPNDEFAEEYFDQLRDVFARQKLVPTYGCRKVKTLLKHLGNTGNILCLRVRDPEGRSIATSIFPGYGKCFYFWGGASYRKYQHYRPNEYMLWQAIRYWRGKGCTVFDMVGVRPYKQKFGSQEVQYAKIVFTRYRLLFFLRNMAERVFFMLLRAKKLFMR